jgi:CO dehydrogenase nickel-insertion accessory protein CooC1
VEAGAWKLVLQLCVEIGVAEEFAAGCYCEAMAWAQSLAATV